nr:hypothetical protein [Sedimentibacter sp.]
MKTQKEPEKYDKINKKVYAKDNFIMSNQLTRIKKKILREKESWN